MTSATERRAPSRTGAAVLIVCLAAVLPYLPTINNYFVRDDYGVVALLSSKPAGYFPKWFASSWMDEIWGHVPDEVRPFPAVSYQLTSLGGAASPFLHHALNIGLHAANGVVVLMIARLLAGLSLPSAAFAAVVFVLLPVHGETVAWITGRVDSMPALFYMLAFLAYARWRARQVEDRDSSAVSGSGKPAWPLYALALVMLFLALFTKQTTITFVGTLIAWDVLIYGWPAPFWRWVSAYVPFAVMTAAYLALRLVLFGQVVRESTLNAEGLSFFGRLMRRHLANVVVADVDGFAVTLAVLAVLAALAWWLAVRAGSGARRFAALLLFFGPAWWIIGVAPTAVAGYESPRHVYLAAAGWAVVIGILADGLWERARSTNMRRAAIGAAALVLAFYGVRLAAVVHEWDAMASVSHKAVIDVRGEALSLPPNSLIVAGAPTRSWEWAVPFSVRPPFTRTDLTTRVFIVTPWLLHCCRGQWFDDTRRTLQRWSEAGGSSAVVVLRWDPETGALAKVTDREYPDLRTVVSMLRQLDSRDALDAAMLKIVNDLPRPVGP